MNSGRAIEDLDIELKDGRVEVKSDNREAQRALTNRKVVELFRIISSETIGGDPISFPDLVDKIDFLGRTSIHNYVDRLDEYDLIDVQKRTLDGKKTRWIYTNYNLLIKSDYQHEKRFTEMILDPLEGKSFDSIEELRGEILNLSKEFYAHQERLQLPDELEESGLSNTVIRDIYQKAFDKLISSGSIKIGQRELHVEGIPKDS